MEQIALSLDKVPHDDSWDVVVVGGGPSGCAAATAASREGARTLLLESSGALGGMGTSGLVDCWAPFSDRKGNIIYGGLAEGLFRQTKQAMPHIPAGKLDWVTFNPEHLKRLLDDMVLSSGARIIFNTTVARVRAGGGRADSVIAAGKSGVKSFGARVFVDCTGDGDVAVAAGAEYGKGDPKTGQMQPATLCFLLANVNTEAFTKGPRLNSSNKNSPMYKIVASGRFPAIKDPFCVCSLLWPGVVTFNAGHMWGIDGTDECSVTEGLIGGRKIAEQFRAALAEFCPETFGQAVLAATAPRLGVRETRRIVGDYVLSLEDYLARRTFPDEIARNNYWIDVHTTREEIAQAAEGHEHVTERFPHYEPGESHGIPYRCLTAKGLDNVLVAGRCISCDHAVSASIRVMPPCLVTGEAAGTAAAMAAGARGANVHAVNTDELRAKLIKHGAYLPA